MNKLKLFFMKRFMPVRLAELNALRPCPYSREELIADHINHDTVFGRLIVQAREESKKKKEGES